jgi:cyclin H
MDYHPKQIMPAALFLATKTENFHTPLKTFVENLKSVPGLNKLTAEEVLAPEFILTQGLRFCFDVRHPHRGLKGFYLECKILDQIAKGSHAPKGFTSQPVNEVQRELLNGKPPQDFIISIDNGYAAVKEYLNSAALLSDAYFLFTPSQILFAAWYLHDPKLIKHYLDLKMLNNNDAALGYLEKVHQVIRECAALLDQTEAQIKNKGDRLELTRIDKKLYQCRNPEKVDLVGMNKAQKRDAGGEGKLDEQVAKKRKLAREKNEKDAEDLFGPDLVKP